MGSVRREMKRARAGRAGRMPAGHAAAAASAVILLSLVLDSCALMFTRPLTVARWSPNSAHPDPSGIETWVEFSAPVDRTKAEQAFALTEDGDLLTGRFSWEANRLLFQPLKAISKGKSYEMSVSASVEDGRGVSLDREFRFSFSTRSDTRRPEILRIEPGPGAVIDDRSAPIVVTFSERIDSTTYLRAFSLSPAVAGVFSWSTDGASCEFMPRAPYQWQTEYVVTIDDAVADMDGNRIADRRVSRFSVGCDRIAPLLEEVRNTEAGIAGGAVLAPDDPAAAGLEMTGQWECGWGFALAFTEQVTRDSLEGSLLAEPGFRFTIEPAVDAAAAFSLKPAERLAWDTIYTLTVRKGITDLSGNKTTEDIVHVFRTNGSKSRPPAVAAVRFRGTPLSEPEAVVDFDPAVPFAALPIGADHFPVAVALPTWFDLHLSLAESAALNLLSAMEHFSIQQTNGCLSMRATSLQSAGFDDPQPRVIAGVLPLRVHVTIVNAADSGIVTLGLTEGFADSLGNPLSAAWQLSLLK